MDITLSSHGDAAAIRRSGSNIRVNAVECGTATVDTTDLIRVTDTSAAGDTSLTIDLGAGGFSPGLTDEPSYSDEIEFDVDLGDGSSDELRIEGGNGWNNAFTVGSDGINLGANETAGVDADVSLAGVESITLDGRGGDDLLDAGGGEGTGAAVGIPTTLLGGGGDDHLTGGLGPDVFDGGDGNDSVDYRDATGAISVTVGDGNPNDGRAGEGDEILSTVEEIRGGPFDDTLIGTTGPQLLIGGDGADRLEGGDGADSLFGEGGADHLEGDNGADILDGGAGSDMLLEDGGGPNGADLLVGGDGVDTVRYERTEPVSMSNDDVVNDGEGADCVISGPPPGPDCEGDDIRSDVETLDVGPGGGSTTGGGPMAIFTDGFENGDLSAWTSSTGISVQGAEVLSGSFAARAIASGGVTVAQKDLPSPEPELWYRIHFKLLSQGSNAVNLVRFLTGGGSTNLLSAFVSSSGRLMLRNFETSANVWSPIQVTQGAWHELEVRVQTDDPGEFETWYDGAPIDRLSDGQNLGTSDVDAVTLGDPVTGRTYDVVFDDVVVSVGGSVTGVINGTPGNDVIVCDGTCSVVNAGDGDDTVSCVNACTVLAGGGDDHVTGSTEADSLNGEAGDDTLVATGGNDALTGGGGRDTLDYGAAPSGVTVDLGAGSATGFGADTVASVEILLGSSHGDSLTGDDTNNRIEGRAGDDALAGGSGTDWLIGGGGADTLDGGAGFDTADYSTATSSISVSVGDELANDGAVGEGDSVQGSIESVIGGSGDDTIIGDDDAELLIGGPGNDQLEGGAGDDELRGEEGADVLSGGPNDDHLLGGPGDDTERGGGYADVFTQAESTIYEGSVSRSAIPDGGTAILTIDVPPGLGSAEDVNVRLDIEHPDTRDLHVSLRSPSGTTTPLLDNRGNGTPVRGIVFDSEASRHVGVNTQLPLDGRFHPDGSMTSFVGEPSGGAWTLEVRDEVAGGTGFVNGWSLHLQHETSGVDGADVIIGGSGMRDLVDYGARSVGVNVTMLSGADDGAAEEHDNVGGDGADVEQAYTGSGDDSVTGTNGPDEIRTSSGDDWIDALGGDDSVGASWGSDSVYGGLGDDVLTGHEGDDIIDGGPGNDILDGRLGNDILDGGTGDDWVTYGFVSGVTVDLTAGTASGGAGNDSLVSIENIRGSSGADSIAGDAGANRLHGEGGNDQIWGMEGDDHLEGNAGTDTLDGGPGVDTCLTGETLIDCE